MLVQLDHIALTAEKLSRHDSFLRALDYERVFSYQGIPNPENKRTLMGEWSDTHGLALYKRSGSIPIEIIDYGYTVDGPNQYELPFEVFTASENCTRLDVTEQHRTPNSKSPPFDHVYVRTPVLDESRKFWTDLGLMDAGEGLLRFDSPMMDGPITVELRSSSLAPRSALLDGTGFRCLAFVTTSIEEDLNRLSDAGYSTTPVRQIKLPHRLMSLAFVIGPGHEPVELVSPI